MLKIHIDHHIHLSESCGLREIFNSLARIENAMSKFTDEIADLNTELGSLTDAVTANGLLIDSILDSVDENAGDETALRELVTNFRAQKDALVANTLKGTPAEPAPTGEDTTAG